VISWALICVVGGWFPPDTLDLDLVVPTRSFFFVGGSHNVMFFFVWVDPTMSCFFSCGWIPQCHVFFRVGGSHNAMFVVGGSHIWLFFVRTKHRTLLSHHTHAHTLVTHTHSALTLTVTFGTWTSAGRRGKKHPPCVCLCVVLRVTHTHTHTPSFSAVYCHTATQW